MPESKVGTINCRHILGDRKLLPDESLKQFCQILQFDYGRGEGWKDQFQRKAYETRVRPQLRKLKFPLVRPSSLLRRAVPSAQSEFAHLCDLHTDLNADFVHQWFKFLSLEVGARLEILRWGGRDYLGAYAWYHAVLPLTALHELWLGHEWMEKTFGSLECHVIPGSMDLSLQQDRCEACILARIGSDKPILLALYSIINSRISLESHAKHPSRLRLLRLVEHWLQLHHDRCADGVAAEDCIYDLVQGSLALAEELYEKREELKLCQYRQRRHQQKCFSKDNSGSKGAKENVEENVKDLEADTVESSIYDAENDIIDTYAALRNTQTSALLSHPGLSKATSKPLTPRSTEKTLLDKHSQPPATELHQQQHINNLSYPSGNPSYQKVVMERYRTLFKLVGPEGQDSINRQSILRYLELVAQCGGDAQKPGNISSATEWPVFANGSLVELKSSQPDGSADSRQEDMKHVSPVLSPYGWTPRFETISAELSGSTEKDSSRSSTTYSCVFRMDADGPTAPLPDRNEGNRSPIYCKFNTHSCTSAPPPVEHGLGRFVAPLRRQSGDGSYCAAEPETQYTITLEPAAYCHPDQNSSKWTDLPVIECGSDMSQGGSPRAGADSTKSRYSFNY